MTIEEHFKAAYVAAWMVAAAVCTAEDMDDAIAEADHAWLLYEARLEAIAERRRTESA